MRRITSLIVVGLMLVGVFSAITVGSAAEFSAVQFTDVIQVHTGGTYPRMTVLQNSAVECYYQSGFKRSLDNGSTFTDAINVNANAATTQDVDGVSHTLRRENHHALEFSDGTMMVAYRSLSSSVTNNKFYTSIRVMTRSNYTGTYGNEQIVVDNVYTSTSGEKRGYWEPFLIQLDDTTVAMYYADDLTPGDGGVNQYIMVVLYDIKTGTWGEPSIAVNKEKNMGREGMPMVARLTDGSYVMAVESHCLQASRKYIFSVRLWFSQDGLNWDKGVVVAAPGAANFIPQFASLDYWCAAPCVTVLPDGRIAVSYQDNYAGKDSRTYINTDKTCNATPCIILSKDKVTYDNAGSLSSSTRGISSSFSELTPNFKDHPSINDSIKNDIYGVWNSTFYANGYLYFCSALGYNTSTTAHTALGTYICRALVDASEIPDAEKVTESYGKLEISRPEQLLQIMNDSTMWTKDIVLRNDIDLSKSVYDASRGIGQTPIGYLNTAKFTGTFDGKGCTIKGLNINNTVAGNRTGLFGYCDGVTIKNCTIYGTVKSNGEYCGAFAGYSQNSHYENLTSYVTVSGTNYVGGIAGRMLGGSKGGSFVNCVNFGAVSGTKNSVGGIVGMLDTNTGAGVNSTVDGCVNYAKVSGNGYIGGIIGQINHLTTKGCYVYVKNSANHGSVSGAADTSCAAGIVGQIHTSATSTNTYNGNVEITSCENSGAVTGKNYIAGIVANANLENNGSVVKITLSECKNYAQIGDSNAVSRVAGIIGRILGTTDSRGTVKLCYNEGDIVSGAAGKDMGGIIAVAKHAEIFDCEARCAITTENTAKSQIGGIVGLTNTYASLKRCYYTGNTAMNPIAGNSPSCESSSNYYYVNSSATDPDGTSVPLEKSAESYSGMDFDNVWYATVLGPRLRYGKTFIKGDVDGNGTVNVSDVIVLQRYLAGWDGYAEYIVYDSADVYNLGSIDVCDCISLIRHLAGWSGYETFDN